MALLLKQDKKLNPIGSTFYHIARTYHGWLETALEDGEKSPDIIPTENLTVPSVQESLNLAFDRCSRFQNPNEKLE